jgi:hypothetical protein
MKIYYDTWLKNNNIKYDLLELKENESVKISNGKEKFWVKIIFINKYNHTIRGIIDNQLVLNNQYNYGDIVEFYSYNILDYHSKNDIKKLNKIMNNFIQDIMIKNNCSQIEAIKIIYGNNMIFNVNN